MKGEDGNIADLEQEGEIWIKTTTLTSGYWNKPDLNNSAFDEEGFITSGDFGYVDLQGNLVNICRIVDLITYKNERVSM